MVQRKDVILFVCAVLFPNVGQIWGSILVRMNVDWFYALEQPWWYPPNWIFAVVGPIWILLYCCMGIASYLAYREVTQGQASDNPRLNRDGKVALVIYIVQIIFNWSWIPLFFGLHSLRWSSIEGTALIALVAACVFLFYRIHRAAGLLFIPYLVWLTYAIALNYALYIKNPQWS